jgi:hypothetical protein
MASVIATDGDGSPFTPATAGRNLNHRSCTGLTSGRWGCHVTGTDAAASSLSESVTEADLLGMRYDALDSLFRASSAGPIPNGSLSGTLLAFPGTPAARPLALLAHVVLWQGKVVDRRARTLRNKVTPLRWRAFRALVSIEASWVDGRECILLDYSRTSFLARSVRDELRLVSPGLYLGVAWLRRRRAGWFTLREQSLRPGRA